MSRKKSLPGNDASILSIFACAKNIPASEVEMLMKRLSCQAAKKIAKAIMDEDIHNAEAKQYLDWANGLRRGSVRKLYEMV